MNRRCKLVGGGSLELSRQIPAVDADTDEVITAVVVTSVADMVEYDNKKLDEKGVGEGCFLYGERGKRIADFTGCVACAYNPNKA